jgi:hypothetical protein
MFAQLRNTLRYVTVKPCNRVNCICYQHLKPPKYKPPVIIEKHWFEEYQICYKDSKKPNKDVFLL